ncbi:MAG: hypothetical protein LBU65_00650 [Planctomycetaceae bacterium]|jgi:hypothetical protein|nr:hypothetical protein [Planctomycetaceae bacterium]
MKTTLIYSCFVIAFFVTVFDAHAETKSDYAFDKNGISREVLENYLRRSITMTECLTVDPYGVDGAYPAKDDDLRFIKNVGAKFIGRAIYRWGKENILNEPQFIENAKKMAEKVHEIDSEIILQGALFEIVTRNVETIKIPAFAFEVLGLPIEDRNFSYEKMLNPRGKFVNHWRNDSSVPDISQMETKIWFMFLAGTYMEVGCEAFHLGQIALIGMDDAGWKHWNDFITKLRILAVKKSRKGWILLDAHTPPGASGKNGGMVFEGRSLLDFNSFPLRIKEIPAEPQKCVLEKGYLDSLFDRSLGCVSPSGWKCDSLPYLVEFDNFGMTRTPGRATLNTHFVWGYDEVSWLYKQDEAYRKEWVKYAYHWVRENDPNGFLQMPVSRVVTTEKGRGKFRANTKSDILPDGLNLEETIKEIFALPENTPK